MERTMNDLSDLRIQSQLYHYAAHVNEVYDGDTMTVDIDLGLGVWRRDQTIRLWKVDTPELRGPDREEGLKVRDLVRSVVLDRPVLIRTILDRRGRDRTGKFGRLLGEVVVEGEDGSLINVNQMLIEGGHAQPMTDEGSKVRRAGEEPMRIPDAIACPYCGQTRRVDGGTGMVEMCPNCLDEAFPVARMV
jgi:micrococcal nuclease